MPGIQYIAPVEFTGTNADTLPIVVNDLPVAGAVRRFVAKAVNQAIGTTVSAWADITGSGTSLVPASSAAPTLATVAGVRSVRFDGATQGLQQNVALTNPHSVVLVMNIVVPQTTGITTPSGSFITAGTDLGQLQTSTTDLYVNAGTSLKVGTGLNVTGWRVIIISFNGASTVVNINGVEYTGNAGTLPRAVFSLGFQRGASWSNMAVAEAILYQSALDATQRAALVTQLRTDHGI
jgi:hypothetical protein